MIRLWRETPLKWKPSRNIPIEVHVLKPYFSVAEKLKKLYTDSVKVSKSRPERSLIVPSRARFSRNTLQMVYVDKSHDYCEKNAKEGSSGTRGRSVFAIKLFQVHFGQKTKFFRSPNSLLYSELQRKSRILLRIC